DPFHDLNQRVQSPERQRSLAGLYRAICEYLDACDIGFDEDGKEVALTEFTGQQLPHLYQWDDDGQNLEKVLLIELSKIVKKNFKYDRLSYLVPILFTIVKEIKNECLGERHENDCG
ncbi:MAG: hypothetical protein AAF378_08860, partial [Cyanobacteria bacterium P01_A01_bin.84]